MIGAKLKNEDLSVIELLENEGEEDMLIDLTICPNEGTYNGESSSGGGNTAEGGQQKKQPLRAVLVKDVMGRLVVPELMTIREHLPSVYQRMVEAGKVDIVLALDNTSRSEFGQFIMKLEQAVIKIVLPGIESAQQSPTLAIPIFFMDGAHCCPGIFDQDTWRLGDTCVRLGP
jgi:hypothetical protein